MVNIEGMILTCYMTFSLCIWFVLHINSTNKSSDTDFNTCNKIFQYKINYLNEYQLCDRLRQHRKRKYITEIYIIVVSKRTSTAISKPSRTIKASHPGTFIHYDVATVLYISL